MTENAAKRQWRVMSGEWREKNDKAYTQKDPLEVQGKRVVGDEWREREKTREEPQISREE